MASKLDVYAELLGMVSEQGVFITTQNEMIAKLVADNMEKENMVNILMGDLVRVHEAQGNF